MARLATFEWHTPPPTSVDEVLALYDDGNTVLVVRRPRRETATIGSYGTRPNAEDLRLLTEAGPGPRVFDLLRPVGDPAVADLMAVADRIAEATLAEPQAVVTFHAHALAAGADGSRSMSLLAVGAGTGPVEFELDPAGSSVHFLDAHGQPMSWQDLPNLPTGFVTPDAEGLGGVLQRAIIRPGGFGAIAFEASPPEGAAAVSILVAGWLSRAFPDESTPERFEVRTARAPIRG